MPFGNMFGWVPRDGAGTNGILVVLEAAGADEAEAGRPTVGKAGMYLWQQLAKVGITREPFTIHNVLNCRPPDNKLIKMPYTDAAMEHCRPNLEATIEHARKQAVAFGKTFVIVALGKFAFRAVMGCDENDPVMQVDYQNYVHWSHAYSAWVLAAPQPSYIMQGNHHLAPTMQFTFMRAQEIADNVGGAFAYERPDYMLDPSPEEFSRWVDQYLLDLRERNDLVLSYDIETPYKSGKNEDEVNLEDSDLAGDDVRILRSAFIAKGRRGVSVPWSYEYMGSFERLFGSKGSVLGWNNQGFDDDKISAYVPFNVVSIDAMLAWHVLNTSLPKGLGFVTPFYWKTCEQWKHLSDVMPAFYNAKDADAALRCWDGIADDLKKNDLWKIFDRHVVQLNEVLRYMSNKGVLLDQEARKAAEDKLTAELAGLEGKIQDVVPIEAKQLKVYKKIPDDTGGMLQIEQMISVNTCPKCGVWPVTAAHFKSVGKKRLKAGEDEQPCAGLKSVKTEQPTLLWAEPLAFKLSNKALIRYQEVRGHKPIVDRRTKRVTFDVKAMKLLRKAYPDDPLYAVVGDFRGTQKILGTYIGITQEDGRIRGGMRTGLDGRVHTTYNHNPSTLRLASARPNMQNLPRKNKADPSAPGNLVRKLIVAGDGRTFVARDFSGIEAVLVGYEAKDPGYVRLARRDVHSFYTAHAMYYIGDKRITANDLPQLSWEDERLFPHLAALKSLYNEERNNLYKHLVHAINFGQSPKGAQDKIYKETGIMYDVKQIALAMDIYKKELFPSIPRWHRRVRQEAHELGHLRNAFGYVHRFSHVYTNKQRNGIWEQVLGDDAEAVLAFRPQSTAAGIMKECLLRLYQERFDEAGQYLRMTIHDEIFCETPKDYMTRMQEILEEEMERPVEVLPLDPAWNMGTNLVVLSEGKAGDVWADMK